MHYSVVHRLSAGNGSHSSGTVARCVILGRVLFFLVFRHPFFFATARFFLISGHPFS